MQHNADYVMLLFKTGGIFYEKKEQNSLGNTCYNNDAIKCAIIEYWFVLELQSLYPYNIQNNLTTLSSYYIELVFVVNSVFVFLKGIFLKFYLVEL